MNLVELIESDKYKNSKFIIEEIEGKYAIREKSSDYYRSIGNVYEFWNIAKFVRKYCLYTSTEIVEAFNKLHSDIERQKEEDRPLNAKSVSINTKDEETSTYKQKLLEGLE